MKEKGIISRLINNILDLESTRLPLWLLIIIVSILFTSLGFLLGIYVHPLLMLLFSSVPIYPIYLSQFKAQKYRKAMILMVVWAITISFYIILLTMVFPSLASKAVISGSSYQEEMFLWIATGVGREGDPSAFIPEQLINAAVFTTLSLASGGILATLFGAYQMNYMNYYVGVLLSQVLKSTPNNLFTVVLLSWPIYAIIRVAGFVLIGVATTIPLANILFYRKVELKTIIRFLLVGTIFIVADIVVKILVAPFYQDLLQTLVNTV
ncbi:hypothetical protein KAS14_06715 [Candidatus Bathyarchaeota archaeon]|nr:hypothetical protein [Candidatus Bathyarchaeota archaeon]